jgi:thymidylate synthase ThyX
MTHHEATDKPLDTCTLVWDGTNPPRVPAAMGTPRGDQLRGSFRDNLIELAGRICYDSLGSKASRNTEQYHEHINQTGHHSTHEHANFTIEIGLSGPNYVQALEAFANRPGVWLELANADPQWDGAAATGVFDRPKLRVTLNPRVVRDWSRGGMPDLFKRNTFAAALLQNLAGHAAALCPKACGDMAEWAGDGCTGIDTREVQPVSDHEVWASLHFENVSRGLSHELVRHGDWTGISQRSTRFVAESESAWIPHPLILRRPELLAKFNESATAGAALYDHIAATLETELKLDPATAGNARKQARGAARGVLGNALETQLIFSASIAQWKWMLMKRCSNAADAEIRLAFANARTVLVEAFPSRFPDELWGLKPAADGLGSVVNCEN